MKNSRYYKGWEISDNGSNYHPCTGRFRAMRFGVAIGTNTREGLEKMIDIRNYEERIRK